MQLFPHYFLIFISDTTFRVIFSAGKLIIIDAKSDSSYNCFSINNKIGYKEIGYRIRK